MVNSSEFIKRLEKILDYYGLSASAFADKIGIQRSGLSHLLSGRNKPSLDFVMRITENFTEVDLYWLLFGKGDFPKDESAPTSYIPTEKRVPSEINTDLFTSHQNAENSLHSNTQPERPIDTQVDSNNKNLDIERIVIFYKNGTFKNYLP